MVELPFVLARCLFILSWLPRFNQSFWRAIALLIRYGP
jgi:hypothetical protein